MEQQPLFPLFGVLLVTGLVTGVAAVVVRFRRSRGAQRQQLKWFVWAVAPIVLLPTSEALPGWVGEVLFSWVIVVLPVAIAVAVLRYRLDGIDVVINRTLVYAVLTAGVVGVYVLVVGYLGAALRREDDLAISLVATGVVAVLFAGPGPAASGGQPAAVRAVRRAAWLAWRNQPRTALEIGIRSRW